MTLNYQPRGLSQISITDLSNRVIAKLAFAKIAKEAHDIEKAIFYERQAEELDIIIDFIVASEIKEITNHALAVRGLKALTFDSNKIVEMVDTQQKIEFDFSKAVNPEQKTIIVLDNPALRAERKMFDRNVLEEAKILDVTEQDLLEGIDHRIKLMRSQILAYIGNGRRQEAVNFIVEKVLKHKEFTQYQAHQLITSLKNKFKVKEPRMTLDYNMDETDVKNYRPVPMGEWIFALYKTGVLKKRNMPTGKGTAAEITVPEEGYGYIKIEPYAVNDMMHNYHGQPLCRVGQITRWRLATRHEIREVIPQTKPVIFEE